MMFTRLLPPVAVGEVNKSHKRYPALLVYHGVSHRNGDVGRALARIASPTAPAFLYLKAVAARLC